MPAPSLLPTDVRARAVALGRRLTGGGVRGDALLALGLAAAAYAPGLSSQGVTIGELPERPLTPLAVALGLAQCLPLVLRRVRPAACLVVVAAAFTAYQLAAFPGTLAGVGLLIALYGAGAYVGRGRAPLAGAALVAYVGFAVALDARGSAEQVVDYVTFAVVLGTCWAAGAWTRHRRREAALRAQRLEEAAAAQERERIARELHDVVTHHVTAMVVQAEAAQMLVDGAPERLPDALGSIGDSGRRALRELREQLRVLADGPAPVEAPRQSIGTGVRELVGRVAASGVDVALTLEGRPDPQPGAAELAAYRVVQEALTNAMKHAPGRRTAVDARYGPEAIVVDVVTDPDGEPGPADRPALAVTAPSDGRGLRGLRARVHGLGGQLTAGRRADGAFVVHATVPKGPPA